MSGNGNARKRKRAVEDDIEEIPVVVGERKEAKLALERIRAKQAEETDSDEESTDEVYTDGGSESDSVSTTNTPLVGVNDDAQMEDEDCLALELDAETLKKHKQRMQDIAAWREKATRNLETWNAQQEIIRLERLKSGDISVGWEMPSSGQPLPELMNAPKHEKQLLKKDNMFTKAQQRWAALLEANPQLREELREHRDSAAAYLPRQQLLNKAREARNAKEAAAYAEHVEKQNHAKK